MAAVTRQAITGVSAENFGDVRMVEWSRDAGPRYTFHWLSVPLLAVFACSGESVNVVAALASS